MWHWERELTYWLGPIVLVLQGAPMTSLSSLAGRMRERHLSDSSGQVSRYWPYQSVHDIGCRAPRKLMSRVFRPISTLQVDIPAVTVCSASQWIPEIVKSRSPS